MPALPQHQALSGNSVSVKFGNGAQQLAGLGGDFLAVSQMAGFVIRDGLRRTRPDWAA